MSEKQRFFMAILLSLFSIQLYIVYRYNQNKQRYLKQHRHSSTNKPDKPQQPNRPAAQPASPHPPAVVPAHAAEPAFPPVCAKEEKTWTIETERFLMRWSNRGAALVSLKLKQYVRSDTDKTKPGWEKQPENWLELLSDFQKEHYSLILCQRGGKSDGQLLRHFLWQLTDYRPGRSIAFKLGIGDGLIYHKRFTFDPQGYAIRGEVLIENQTKRKVQKILALGGAAGMALEGARTYQTEVFGGHKNKRGETIIQRYSYGRKIDLQGQISWTAFTNKYFAAVLWVTRPELFGRLQAEQIGYQEKTGGKKIQLPQLFVTTAPLEIDPGQQVGFDFKFLVATKEELASQEQELRALGSYGFFDVISRLLLWILGFFYDLFGNYGVAIICLTLVVKSILHPLTVRQQRSMQDYQEKMRIIQPKLRELQRKYRNNKQELNKRMMELYRREGVSMVPMGGCLPIFLQLPIFIGLYNALLYSLSLRQAPFLWIKDLSMPDHLLHLGWPMLEYFNLLPILMTVMWVVQQQMMPKSDDPQMQQQQKMMLIMPVIFGFLFYSVASGLVLYWLVMNIFSIIEQWYIKKQRTAVQT